MILGGIVGAVVALLVIALGVRAPVPARGVAELRAASRTLALPAWVGLPLAAMILIGLLLGAGAAGAGGLLLLLVVSLVVLLALAGAWSWFCLRPSP